MMVNLGLYILIIKNVTCGRLQQATSGKDADIRERRKRLKATILIFLTLGKVPCPAELFQLYFSSFEAGIANEISSFKRRKKPLCFF